MDTDRESKLSELQDLKTRIAELEVDLAYGKGPQDWVPDSYYTTYHILAGMVLGLISSASSLLLNVVGATMVGKHPLELIRVYLTFPMGESAFEFNSGFALAAGCCLYLGTGMIGGVPFHYILTRFFSSSSTLTRFMVASVMGIGVWLINFYGILSWLQPALIGGSWILEQVPVLVAALTHLVFGWTMLLLNQWGRFVPPSVTASETHQPQESPVQ